MTCVYEVPLFVITWSFQDATVCTWVLVVFGSVTARSESTVVVGNFQYVELAVNVLYVVLSELSCVFGVSVSRDAIVILPVGLGAIKLDTVFSDDVVAAPSRT